MQRSKATFWQQAILLRILVHFICGMLASDLMGTARPGTLMLYTFLVFQAALLILSYKYNQRVRRLSSVFVYTCFFTLGLCHMPQQTAVPLSTYLIQNEKACVCYVLQTSRTKTGSHRFEVLILRPDAANLPACKGLLYVRDTIGASISAGDTLLAPMHWERIQNSGLPFAFNYAKHYARRGIFLRSYCRGNAVVITGKAPSQKVPFLTQLSDQCSRRFDRSISDASTRALLKAMILGDEGEIDPETRSAYSDTGIIHIISISGAHVALLFTLINMLLFWVSGKSKRWIVFIASMTLIILYVAMAGSPSSAVRAALMFLLVQTGMVSQRQANPINQLAAAALLMLLFRPLWLFNIGFQLSFLAVLSLIFFYRPLIQLWPGAKGIGKWLRNAFAASIAAEILVAPLVAYYFHSFPLLFLPANLIAAAGMTLIEVLGIFLLLLYRIAALQTMISASLTAVSQVFHYLIGVLQQATLHACKTIWLGTVTVILIYLFIASAALFLKRRDKTTAWTSVLCLLMLSGMHIAYLFSGSTTEMLVLWKNGQTPGGILLNNRKVYCLTQHTCDPGDIQPLLMRKNATYTSRYAPKAFMLGTQKVVIADSMLVPDGHFPVDILLISKHVQSVSPSSFVETFSPSVIVISGYLREKTLDLWKYYCREKHIRFHYLPRDGAFVYTGTRH